MRSRPWIVHPLLVAASPGLFLWQHNRTQLVSVTEPLTFLAVAVGGTGLAWFLVRRVVNDAHRAALLATLLSLVVLTYGHYAMATTDALRRLASVHVSEDAFVLFLPVLALATVTSVLILRAGPRARAATGIVQAVSAGIVIVSLVTLALAPGATYDPAGDVTARAHGPAPDALPNVYYVVPDEYGNAAMMRDVHGYRNGDFVAALEARGFLVPADTRANYGMTAFSLASTLNMRYLDDLAARVGEDSVDLRPAYALIRENVVASTFRAYGYDVIHFDSGWAATESTPLAHETIPCGRFSEFERTALETTLLSAFADQIVNEDVRDRVRCQFDALAALPERVAAAERPTFTFAHVQSPHGPFVLDAHGNAVHGSSMVAESDDPSRTRSRLYFEQVQYVNARLLEFVDNVTTHDPDAIVIIQSDHGMNLLDGWDEHDPAFIQDRLRNFNAFRLPSAKDVIPDDFTNVNTFRVILDHALGTGHETLPDRVFFSDAFHPYAFRDVTNLTAFGTEAAAGVAAGET